MELCGFDQITLLAKALSDPHRVYALMLLDEGEICHCDMAEKLGLALSTVSRHMSILEEAGLVSCRKDGRWRYYRHAEAESPGCAQYAVSWVRHFIKRAGVAAETMQKPPLTPSPHCQPKKPNVLFLCSKNSCRSQISEALLRHYAGDEFHIYSAGIEPAEIHPMVYRVMDEIGVSLDGQYPKTVFEFLGKMHFAYLITVCPRAEKLCPTFVGVSYRLNWPFEDPAEYCGTEQQRLEKFRQVRDQIDAQILKWLAELSTKSLIGKSYAIKQ